jgi:tRNA threonylcarbamoyladenosine biosynthesis protein TsaE
MVDQIPLLPSPLTLQSESEMIDFGRQLAQKIQPPTLIELVGDVGAGKTTITRGLALGLGITEPVTSPSFTISKQYPFPGGTLVHYDFYRLHSPGLMQDNLLESIEDSTAVTVVEWADSVAEILPTRRHCLKISLNDDNSRTITEISPAPFQQDFSK